MVASGISNWVLKGQKPRNLTIPENPSNIGERIRKFRIENGLTQKDIANRIGVRTDSITNWELGRNEPQIQFMPKIQSLLGTEAQTSNTHSEEIIQFRSENGLSRKRMARMIGIDETTLKRIESNNHSMRLNSKIEIVLRFIRKKNIEFETQLLNMK